MNEYMEMMRRLGAKADVELRLAICPEDEGKFSGSVVVNGETKEHPYAEQDPLACVFALLCKAERMIAQQEKAKVTP